MNNNCYAAIDLGASSGRVVVSYLQDQKICLEEIHRFDNLQNRIDNHDCWDLDMLYKNILVGLKKCKNAGYQPKSIGIDTWGVDFVSIDNNGNLIGNAIAYRDDRTKGIMDRTEPMRFEDIYKNAGIQKLQFNSLYQIVALKEQDPQTYDATDKFLMVPDYLIYKLCGIKSAEYTICSTTSMLDADTCNWDNEIFSKFNIDKEKFLPVQMPGEIIAKVTDEVEKTIGYSTQICQVASHDTGSAYLAVPAKDDNSVYISSGTWSLLGCEIEFANTSKTALANNFTNEGGYQKRYRFLKNIMGLWIIQSIRRELNGVSYVNNGDKNADDTNIKELIEGIEEKEYSFLDLANESKKCQSKINNFNVNDDRFLSPKSMITEIVSYYKENNLEAPSTLSQLMKCVYVSLGECYKQEIKNLESVLDKKFNAINIVGGGTQDNYLNQLIADICNLDVYAGPIEATALGNIGVQMIADAQYSSLQEFKNALNESFQIIKYSPAK